LSSIIAPYSPVALFQLLGGCLNRRVAIDTILYSNWMVVGSRFFSAGQYSSREQYVDMYGMRVISPRSSSLVIVCVDREKCGAIFHPVIVFISIIVYVMLILVL
jgi:hypothetical protein